MGDLVETGLGWYLDEDYLRTVGNTVLCTVSTSSPGSAVGYKSTTAGETLFISAGNHPVTKYNNDPAWYAALSDVSNWSLGGEWIGVSIGSGSSNFVQWKGETVGSFRYFVKDGIYYYYNTDYWGQSFTPVGDVPTISFQGHAFNPNDTYTQDFIISLTDESGTTTKNVIKVQGGAGAFAIVSYPHDGNTVYVGVGISSIPNPNSAATVAVDGTNGSYNTFNRESMQFTMFYTEQLTGELNASVPVVALDTDISALPGLYEFRLFLAVANAAQVHVGYVPADEDPYEGGGTSVPSDGTPDFTEVSESISPGSTFPISFQSTGLCRVYVPSLSDLNDLATYLWTDQTFLDTIKNALINQFENFMEAVISLTMVPCQVPSGTAQPVKVMFLPTGLSFPPATQQFVEVDCGYVDITERYASALDYNPYTKVSLYLPFIGTVPLDTDEVMGHRLKCIYTIDIVSGACVAKIMVNYPDSSNGVLYQFSGHCSISMPLTAADFSSYYAAAMSGLKMAAGLAAAGAGAPGLAGTLLGEPTAHPSSTTTTTRTTERNAATGRQILAGTESRETSHTPGQASFKELATRASVNTVGAVINSKFSVEHSGGFTGNTGFLGVQAPYVIITRPDMCNPDEYGAYNGRPSMMYLYLGNLSGFTQVQNIKLTGIPATNPELGEIAELLKTGVIL